MRVSCRGSFCRVIQPLQQLFIQRIRQLLALGRRMAAPVSAGLALPFVDLPPELQSRVASATDVVTAGRFGQASGACRLLLQQHLNDLLEARRLERQVAVHGKLAAMRSGADALGAYFLDDGNAAVRVLARDLDNSSACVALAAARIPSAVAEPTCSGTCFPSSIGLPTVSSLARPLMQLRGPSSWRKFGPKRACEARVRRLPAAYTADLLYSRLYNKSSTKRPSTAYTHCPTLLQSYTALYSSIQL